jgi:SAM-dependent methyltransferase
MEVEADLDSYFTAHFDSLRIEAFADLFDGVSETLWSEQFFATNELANLYTDLAVADVLRRLGAIPRAPLPPLAEARSRWRVIGDRESVLDWLLAKANESRIFAVGGDGGGRDALLGDPRREGFRTATQATIPPSSDEKNDKKSDEVRSRIRARILHRAPGLEPVLALTDLVSTAYPSFLRGETSGNDILFAPATLGPWDAYFSNTNPLYAPSNIFAASVVAARLESRSVPTGEVADRRGLNVLEVGAGCGSGAEALLDALPERSGRYVLTDLSPRFLRSALDRLSAGGRRSAWEIEARPLDLDRPRDAWRLEKRSFDLVFGVNVLHCARDIRESLSGLRELLRPGGLLVLGECVRARPGRPVHVEFAFQLFDGFFREDRERSGGARWPFLDAVSWTNVAREAGFRSVEVLPDFEKVVAIYPGHSIGALVASP